MREKNQLRIVYLFMPLICLFCISCESTFRKQNNLNERIEIFKFLETYSHDFRPITYGLEESLSDSAKYFINKIVLNDTVLLKDIELPIEKILLKLCYFHLHETNRDFNIYTSKGYHTNKILNCFLMNNGIDTAIYKRKERGFTTYDSFQLIANKYKLLHARNDVDSLIRMITKEQLRIEKSVQK